MSETPKLLIPTLQTSPASTSRSMASQVSLIGTASGIIAGGAAWGSKNQPAG